MKKLIINILLFMCINNNFGMQQKNNGTQSMPTSPTQPRVIEPARTQTPQPQRANFSPELESILSEIARATIGLQETPSSGSNVGSEISHSDDDGNEPKQKIYQGSITWCGSWLPKDIDQPIAIITIEDKDGNKLINEQEFQKGQTATWSIQYNGRVRLKIKQKTFFSVFEPFKDYVIYPEHYCLALMGKDIIFKHDCQQC